MSVIEFGTDSHTGLVRSENQDAAGKFPPGLSDDTQEPGLLFIVADGMGGHRGGKEASAIAVATASDRYFSAADKNRADRLRMAVEAANQAVLSYGETHLECRGMGSTLTALVLHRGNALIAHVGDSRAYRISDGTIIQLTQDHSIVGEWLRKGWMSEEQAKIHPERSLLYRAVGVKSDLEIDLTDRIPVKSGDCFLLCSDGLTNHVMDDEIRRLVLEGTPQQACEKLVLLAMERGGYDNITVQAIRVVAQ